MLTLAALALLAQSAAAQLTVQQAWVRGTVPAQKATGAFMQLTSAKGGQLVAVSTPVAGVAEVHEMKMEGSVMKMGALTQGLPLPAGEMVELKPGGYHLMLMDLKQPLKAGDTVPLTLVVVGRDGQRESHLVQVPVRPLNAPAMPDHGAHAH